jgi:hypothetical protein
VIVYARENKMTLTLDIPPDLERRLNHEAEKLGLHAQEYTLRLLGQHLPAKDRSASAVDLLQSWIDDDRMHSPSDAEALNDACRQGWLTPPRAVSGDPPPRLPVAPLHQLLAELQADRDDR